jgi:SPP1 gp7 family putative phage head morphogenesis protein
MPLQLSPEAKADPTRALPIVERQESKAAAFVRKYFEEVKRRLREQEFANAKMSPLDFLRFADSLARQMGLDDKAIWTDDWASAVYGQGRHFSSVVLGAPLEIRQQAWKKTGMILQKGQRVFAKMTGDMSADVRREISDAILKERSQGDMIKAIDDLAQTYDYAAKRIVRTETMEAVNIGVMDGYRAHEVEKVEWLAAEGCCPRCQELDGHVFGIDSGVSAPLHPNCRCTVIPVIDIPGREPTPAEAWTDGE